MASVITTSAWAAVWGQAVQLAENGQARLPVVVSPDADPQVREAAGELADYLGRITGGTFAVEQGDPSSGIAVGLPGDFADLPFDLKFQQGIMHGDDYLLRSHAQGLWVLGTTPDAIFNAVWDLLYRTGHRQFFPGDVWEVIPSDPNLQIAVDVVEHPDYWTRRLSSGTSRGAEAWGDREQYRTWTKRNRLSHQVLIHSGHAYGAIIRRNREQFDAHPEYRALVDGERRGSKFCISNPGLQQLVVADALKVLENNPDRLSVSMDPSDGGGWCECEPCKQYDSVTNRVVALANMVAKAIPEDRYVGIYAYNFHSPPPTIRVHPRVVVQVTAGHLTGGWQAADLFEPWAAMGGAPFMGLFEYYNNIISSFLPQGQRASDLGYLKMSIPDYHRRGARLLVSGTAYGNGAIGLGAYIAARIAWDVTEAQRVDELYADFLERAFKSAAEPMDRFYRQVYVIDEQSPRMPLTSDKVGRMYRALHDALEMTSDPAVTQRIMDLVAYTRYVEIYLDYAAARGDDARVEAYGDLLRFAWQIRRRMVVNTYGLFAFPQRVKFPENTRWNIPESENPWKESAEVTDADLLQWVSLGIENNPVHDYQMRWFSEDLVPAAAEMGGDDRPAVRMGLPPQGRQVFYTWVDQAPATIELQVQGGAITHYRHRMGPVSITLYSEAAIDDAMNFVVAEDQSVLPDGEMYVVRLATPHEGLHRIEVSDGGGGTLVLPGREGMGFTVDLGPSRVFNSRHIWSGYFYVPKGTETLSLFVSQPVASPPAQIRDSQGRTVLRFPAPNDPVTPENEHLRQGGYFSIPVPPGEDGAIWHIHRARGQWRLMNVPPYLAPQPSQLLLPREVVQADRPGVDQGR